MGKWILTGIESTLTTIGVIAAIVGGFYILKQYIDNRIKHTVNNEQFIKEVASHVRPYVIFDVNGTICVDGGAMQYLEKIEVEQVAVMKEDAPRFNITITPKSHLAHAPLLEGVSTMFDITPKRGKGHQWIYELTAAWTVSDKQSHFRLEILR